MLTFYFIEKLLFTYVFYTSLEPPVLEGTFLEQIWQFTKNGIILKNRKIIFHVFFFSENKALKLQHMVNYRHLIFIISIYIKPPNYADFRIRLLLVPKKQPFLQIMQILLGRFSSNFHRL